MSHEREKLTLYNTEFYRSTSYEISGARAAAERFVLMDLAYLYGGEIELDEGVWMNPYTDNILHPTMTVHEARAIRKKDGVVVHALIHTERCPYEHKGKWRVCLYTDFKEDRVNKSLRHVYEAAPVRFFERTEFKPRCSC
jgi:hypothetical protein